MTPTLAAAVLALAAALFVARALSLAFVVWLIVGLVRAVVVLWVASGLRLEPWEER